MTSSRYCAWRGDAPSYGKTRWHPSRWSGWAQTAVTHGSHVKMTHCLCGLSYPEEKHQVKPQLRESQQNVRMWERCVKGVFRVIVVGWTLLPRKKCSHLPHPLLYLCMWLQSNQYFENVIKMSSYWIEVNPTSSYCYPWKGETFGHRGTQPSEKTIWRRRQRLQWFIYKSRNAATVSSVSRASRQSLALLTLWLWTRSFQSSGRTHFRF